MEATSIRRSALPLLVRPASLAITAKLGENPARATTTTMRQLPILRARTVGAARQELHCAAVRPRSRRRRDRPPDREQQEPCGSPAQHAWNLLRDLAVSASAGRGRAAAAEPATSLRPYIPRTAPELFRAPLSWRTPTPDQAPDDLPGKLGRYPPVGFRWPRRCRSVPPTGFG